MYLVLFSGKAKKDLRRHSKSGSFPLQKLERAVEMLRQGKSLPASYQDHALKGDMAGYREFHLAGDMLVQYEIDRVVEVVTIATIGTHQELFGK